MNKILTIPNIVATASLLVGFLFVGIFGFTNFSSVVFCICILVGVSSFTWSFFSVYNKNKNLLNEEEMNIKNILMERYGDDYLCAYADDYESAQKKKKRSNSKYLWFGIAGAVTGIYVVYSFLTIITNL